ncbi:MAG: flippase [bacterium]|nr:flippase [bacterium]
MSIMQKVAQNTALQFIGKILGTVLGFSATLFLLRYLGDEKYGNYTTALAYLQLFGIVMDLGLYIVLLKHISSDENKNGKLQNNIFSARLVTAIFFLVTSCILVWFIPTYPTIVKWCVIVVAANFFFITMNQLLMGIYQKNFAMGKVAIAEVVGKTFLFISTLLVVFVFKAGLLAVMLTVVLAGGINFLILWIGVRKYTRINFAFDLSVWKRIFKESWPVALSIALNLIYFKADTIILGFFQSQAEVGIYGAPYKILEVIITLPAMIVGLVMPVLGKAFASKDMGQFKKIYQQSFNAVIMIAAPLVAGTLVVAHPFMQLVAGNDFTDKQNDLGSILQILILAVGAIFIGTLTGYLIVVINKQKSMLWGYGFIAITAFIGYLYFIPKYSYFGAAWVTVYSEIAIMLIAFIIIWRSTGVVPSFNIPLRIILASIVMGVILLLLGSINVVIVILVGLIVYPAALLVLKAISKQEIMSILKLRTNE